MWFHNLRHWGEVQGKQEGWASKPHESLLLGNHLPAANPDTSAIGDYGLVPTHESCLLCICHHIVHDVRNKEEILPSCVIIRSCYSNILECLCVYLTTLSVTRRHSIDVGMINVYGAVDAAIRFRGFHLTQHCFNSCLLLYIFPLEDGRTTETCSG
jgi:hypothetical protein